MMPGTNDPVIPRLAPVLAPGWMSFPMHSRTAQAEKIVKLGICHYRFWMSLLNILQPSLLPSLSPKKGTFESMIFLPLGGSHVLGPLKSSAPLSHNHWNFRYWPLACAMSATWRACRMLALGFHHGSNPEITSGWMNPVRQGWTNVHLYSSVRVRRLHSVKLTFSPLKLDPLKRRFLWETTIFRGELLVSGRVPPIENEVNRK